jgi:hypothetical protein
MRCHRTLAKSSFEPCGNLRTSEYHLNLHGDRKVVFAGGLARFKSTLQTELAVDALDTVGGVDVLDQCQLVAGGTTLSGGDGAVGEEVLPDLYNDVSRLQLLLLKVIGENIPCTNVRRTCQQPYPCWQASCGTTSKE